MESGIESMIEFRHKQVIVLRSDLKMSKGKMVAQAGHAVISSAEKSRRYHENWWKAWMKEGQCKIAVKVKSEKELLELETQAHRMRLPCILIIDRGLTEVPPGTKTCLGIGPAPAEKIDKLTGALPLL